MTRGRRGHVAGFTVIVTLPWIIAAAAFLFGILSWLGHRPAPRVVEPVPLAELQELKGLRFAMATTKAENEALRRELDRLLAEGLLRSRPGHPAGKEPTSGSSMPGDSSVSADPSRRDAARRLEESLALLAGGDERAKGDAAKAIMEILPSGPAAFATFRDAYAKAAGATGRRMLVGAMLFSGSAEAPAFIVDQAVTETDPDLRRTLVTQAAKYATPQTASRLEGTFLDALSTGEDPETRRAAIRGLRYAPGSNVPAALMQAARDSSEEVRLAAIDVLTSRAGERQELRDMIERDPSPRVRKVGECRLIIAEDSAS